MKKTFVLLYVLLVSTMKMFAQEPAKTIFTTPKINQIGLYVAPEYQYGQLKSEFTSLGGMSLMAIFNQKMAIGFTAQRGIDQSFSPKGINPLYFHANMGGLKLEYTPKPTAAVHVSFPLFIGMGTAQADSNYTGFRNNTNDSIMRANRANRNDYVIIQPGVQVEANLIKYIKGYVGVNYRFAFDRDNTNTISASSMSGVAVYAGLKIGLFDYNIRKKE